MRYLVTGGAGFIGSHLVEALVARGDQVRVLDDFSTGRIENLAAVWDRIEVLTGDITVPADVERAVRDVDAAFHLAARVSVPESVEQPRRYHDANVGGTFNVLLAAKEAGLRRLVFASSCGVYGAARILPTGEDQPTAPLSPYTFSKLAGEQYCRLFAQLYGLPTIALRFFNVYGPRQRADSGYAGVITRFCARLRAGEPPTIFGDGYQSRDFVYVADVARACLAAAGRPVGSFEVFNVGTGRRCTVRELAATLGKLFGSDREPLFAPAQPADVRHSLALTGRAENLLGLRANTSLADGLAAVAEWYRAQVVAPGAAR